MDERVKRQIICKKELALYKLMIKKAKQECLRNFLEKIVNRNSERIIMGIIKDKKSEIKISQIVKENDEITNSYGESIDYVLKQHFPQLVETEMYLKNVEYVDTEDFTINEVEACFLSMNKYGAPGIDGWSLDFIREIFIANRQWFLKVLNYCLSIGYFPNVWKTAKVLLIPKGGKDLSQYESYRPICLLPIWGKVFEKLLTNRLVTYLEDNKLSSDHQYGFRKGRSTEDALMRIKLFIETAKESEMVSCMISLDIQNAFNSIHWLKLLPHRNRVPGKIARVIYSFLRDRHIIYAVRK
ncbi:RNA-directed DNA polymerase from mobile element jockey [Araneus ventricosus]|uniref:RNA-directed DNA polymerase from mobile element jockey n=1 Tax=Araneus ventricosus TaxID=182803 RepID=A0A4Y2DEK0_ARAVE|nr:RNA-directed DNA polymerase from mobile element jockey [Araneus ventricosus]